MKDCRANYLITLAHHLLRSATLRDFPRRFFFAKIQTARRLLWEIGGAIVFFFHDSDDDPWETVTILRNRHAAAERRLNFTLANGAEAVFAAVREGRVTRVADESGARIANCVTSDASTS